MGHQTAVIYLAREAEPRASIERFAESYAKNSSGQPHDLVVIWKSSAEGSQPPSHVTGNFPKTTRYLSIADDGIDITAYAHAAEVLLHPMLCFFNTHTEIAEPNWLRFLSDAIAKPGVGIAGGTGSFESLKDGFQIVSKIAWLSGQGVVFDKQFRLKWAPIVGKDLFRKSRRSRFQKIKDALIGKPTGQAQAHSSNLDHEFDVYWSRTQSPYEDFPAFPNPHIRTNGFLVARHLFLKCLGDDIPRTKPAAYAFESGPNSLTQKLLTDGLRALIVGRDGKTFDLDTWKTSETFRLGTQRNLLFLDNQTRAFDAMKPRKRHIVSQMTWGIDASEKKTGEIELPCVNAPRETDFISQILFQTKRLFSS
ncbi:hypothetical protein [Hyphomicrobium sp. MC1]|uniref:hypothetical protein n=1 Tax=Hyphomicrobium sp. (strain MC1) TaxID=717785 RepID=UPI000213D826|nr:hypothetical protein [Hyphomicrobium sp. MC1]CCB65056.1 protein of unknown function [Hyphomicrobium sp. MC1]